MKYLSGLIGILLCLSVHAQVTQTVRGKIVDAASQFPLAGATFAFLEDGKVVKGTVTGADGKFRLDGIPTGRRNFKVQYVGYDEKVLNNIVVSSGKEVVLFIELDEGSQNLNEVTVQAKRDGEVQNEMATVSAREFSVDETNRYAGSRGDPARMASNFAGVQGADDSRNDIIIRGNSPQSVLWQIEGVALPNPNHFAIPGTNGGPVGIVNFKTLRNSDFYTGAFPAEFGNSTAGVFDIKLRNGNNQQREFSGQFGLFGVEAFAEGPINREKGSSYLINYRYSTVSLFLAAGIDLGTNSRPTYQDATFRFNFPQKNGAELAFWGMGGLSGTSIMISDQVEPVTELYGQSDRDQHFYSRMGIMGLTYSYPINRSTFWKTSLAASHQRVDPNHDYIVNRDTLDNGNYDLSSVVLKPIMAYTFRENKYTLSTSLYKKIKARSIVKAGLMLDVYDLAYHDSIRARDSITGIPVDEWTRRWDSDGGGVLVQPFVQWKYDISDRLEMNLGLHAMYYSLSNSLSPLEPRAGLKYKMARRQSLTFGTGLHSQIQSNYLYYYSNPDLPESEDGTVLYNKDMDLSKSIHAVLGYNNMVGRNMRLKVETYVQTLYNIPVEANRESAFSLVNAGSGFSRLFPNELTNDGSGLNYGVEFTLERFFSGNYFYMVTASLYQSKYIASNGDVYNTDFNGNYAINMLGTKEFEITDNATIGIGTKVTMAGGRRYGLVDSVLSAAQEEVVWLDNQRNEFQFRDYFRTDLRMTYVVNRPKVSHELAIDLINLFDTPNILSLTWAPGIDPNSPITENYQLGFLPAFYYKFDF